MNTRLSAVWIAVALVVSLAGCGRTGELSDSKSAADTAPAKADVPPPQAQAVTIAEGTPIKVRTDTTLSTKDTKTGDTFKATLSEPIVVEGKEIAPLKIKFEKWVEARNSTESPESDTDSN